jgi:hypothetical protein
MSNPVLLPKYDAAVTAISEMHEVMLNDEIDDLKTLVKMATNRESELEMAKVRLRADREAGGLMGYWTVLDCARLGCENRFRKHGNQKYCSSTCRRNREATKL